MRTVTELLGVPTKRRRSAAREALRGRRRGLKALLPFLGPAFVAAVAYVDPGNFATNIQGGAQFGYRLLWVVLFANLLAPSWGSSGQRSCPMRSISTPA